MSPKLPATFIAGFDILAKTVEKGNITYTLIPASLGFSCRKGDKFMVMNVDNVLCPPLKVQALTDSTEPQTIINNKDFIHEMKKLDREFSTNSTVIILIVIKADD